MEHLYKRNKPSQRQLQVGVSIHRAVIEAIQMNEILYSKFFNVSFLGVRMNSGLKQANIMFSTTGNAKNIKNELNQMSGYFRKIIGNSLKLRFVPEIFFIYDNSAVQMEMLEENLNKIKSYT